tara:strand:+ start:2183 stop:2512 length:330 start_codon:yes stop_codon:yes gene_type:complete
MLNTTTIKTVKLTEVLRSLQIEEWNKLGLKEPDRGQSIKLPDGRDDIYSRLWKRISSARHGNQVFSNDTIHIFVFPTINGEKLSEDEQALYDFCKDAIVDETIYFEISW